MRYSARSHPGKRYDHNEDQYVLPEPNKKYGLTRIDKKKKGSLFVLCDGMGGSNAGEVASELAANWIYREYYTGQLTSIAPHSILEKAILNVNEQIFKLAGEHTGYSGMGSTLVSVLFIEGEAYIYSIGDSRAYLFRNKKLSQITEDQSEVWELYKRGEITKDEIRTHPRNNIITMAIGTKKNMKIEDINRYQLKVRKRDLFLVCSDGLTDMMSDEDVTTMLSSKRTLKQKTSNLVDMANANGGRDNITVILIRI